MTHLNEGVLIADSHRLVRGGMMSIMSTELAMLDVIGVDDFDGVMAAVAGRPGIKLLLLDSGLPGMGGMQGLRMIRMERPDLRVVIMAWHQDRAEAFEALAAGAHGYLPKDLSAPEMVQALQTVLSGQIYVPAIISDLSLRGSGFPADGDRDRDRIPAELTIRQREVLTHLAAGMSNKEIARALNIAEGTVKVHITAAFRTLHVHNRVGAAAALLKLSGPDRRGQPDLPGLTDGMPPAPRNKDTGSKFALACLPLMIEAAALVDSGLPVFLV